MAPLSRLLRLFSVMSKFAYEIREKEMGNIGLDTILPCFIQVSNTATNIHIILFPARVFMIFCGLFYSVDKKMDFY